MEQPIFEIYKQFFEYQHLLLETSGYQSSKLYSNIANIAHFFNTGVNLTSVAD
jgi:hypothetical protein